MKNFPTRMLPSLPSFEAAKDATREAMNVLLGRIKDTMQSRSEVAENPHVLNAAIVLNTEGWERSSEDGDKGLAFADDCLIELYGHFKVPLSNAGTDGALNNLLEQWHCLLEYTKQYLNPSRPPTYVCGDESSTPTAEITGVWCCFWSSFCSPSPSPMLGLKGCFRS